MFLSLSNNMTCLILSNSEDKSNSSSCISCPISSELYKFAKKSE